MSGNHRGGGQRTDGPGHESGRNQPNGGYPAESGDYGYGPSGGGEYDPRSGEYRTVRGGHIPGSEYGTPSGEYNTTGTGGYGSGAYPTGGTGTGRPPTGRYGAGAYETRESGGYGSGGYGSGPSETGPYNIGSGGYASGGYASGGYGSISGEYRRGLPPPSRRSPSSGGYRAGTGSHRVVRDRRTGRRNLALVLAGVVAAVGACLLAAFTVLGGVGSGDDDNAGQAATATASGSPSSQGERSIVPDACRLVDARLADRLAPKADRTQADNYQSSDRQNQCVWGAYTGDNKRQLTVELRAIAGSANQTATDVARGTFGTERKADESGKALLAGQELTERAPLEGVGEEGYVVYSVDEGQGSGEAVANVRVVNVLVTVHYSGGDSGKPLAPGTAMDGAAEVVKAVVSALDQS